MTSFISTSATCSTLISPEDAEYPKGLMRLNQAPKLYRKGTSFSTLRPIVAILGSKSPSPYGISNTLSISKDLVDSGLCICANVEEGISSIALNCAVRSGYPHACTAFCLAGIEHSCSGKFKSLTQKIQEQGYLYSEYADALAPDPQYIKNNARLIAGISRALVIVESPLNTRLTHTIQWALELGKDVFVVPGHVHDKRYQGNHYLIKNGAKLIESAQDIFEELNLSF